jgi:hypothetical protein
MTIITDIPVLNMIHTIIKDDIRYLIMNLTLTTETLEKTQAR